MSAASVVGFVAPDALGLESFGFLAAGLLYGAGVAYGFGLFAGGVVAGVWEENVGLWVVSAGGLGAPFVVGHGWPVGVLWGW